MVFNRHISTHLEAWKSDPHRKPLILKGARQVGKTTLIEQFAKSYAHRIILNLEKKADKAFFDRHDDVKTIVDALFIAANISIDDLRNTLLFIDEIQESPKAIQLLRYFYEEFPGLHVIAAGSLLEFALRKVRSFPVGRVAYLYLHPLNFAEYLTAIGHHQALEQLNRIPVSPAAHDVLLSLFHRYAIIGGMPEAVKRVIEKDSLTVLPPVYEGIWATYRKDVEKYSSRDAGRNVIKHIMNTAHLYLDQRIKFQNFGHSNYRSREVGEAFRSLDEAQIIQLIYPTTDTVVPVKPDLRKSPKLQFLDTGLVNHALQIQAEMLALTDLNNAYRGAIVPHLITQELMSLNTISYNKPHFWVREKKQSSSEVDLVYACKALVIPIEIKSGATGSLKSLHQFVERAPHPYAVRLYSGAFKIEKAKSPGGVPYLLMNLPFYLGTKIPEYIDYFVNNHKL